MPLHFHVTLPFMGQTLLHLHAMEFNSECLPAVGINAAAEINERHVLLAACRLHQAAHPENGSMSLFDPTGASGESVASSYRAVCGAQRLSASPRSRRVLQLYSYCVRCLSWPREFEAWSDPYRLRSGRISLACRAESLRRLARSHDPAHLVADCDRGRSHR